MEYSMYRWEAERRRVVQHWGSEEDRAPISEFSRVALFPVWSVSSPSAGRYFGPLSGPGAREVSPFPTLPE